MIETDRERLGADSASSGRRRRRCVGSSNLIRALREAGTLTENAPAPNSDAANGILIHGVWSGERAIESLNLMQRQTLEALVRMERMVVTDWAGNDAYTLLGREKRMWLHQGLEPIHSGQFDVAYGTLHTHRMLIIDGKTLFSEVDPAETNDQLRELVALARFNFRDCVEFTVAILQPWVTQRPSIAVYDAAEAELALRLLRLTIADSADPDAPRTAGPWCKYCPALSKCEEARAAIGATYRLAKRIQAGEFTLPIGERGTKVLDSIETAQVALLEIKASYKALLEQQPDAVPGWSLKAGNSVREIEDIARAYAIATTEARTTQDDFLACAKVSITALQEAVGNALNLKGKRLLDHFNDIFAPVIAFKQNAPSLVRTSKRKVSEPIANAAASLERPADDGKSAGLTSRSESPFP